MDLRKRNHRFFCDLMVMASANGAADARLSGVPAGWSIFGAVVLSFPVDLRLRR